MRIAYDNFIDDLASTAFTVSSYEGNYPITNVQEERLKMTWRTTSASSQSVIIDFGTALSVNTCAILGHNLTASAQAVISANSVDSWPGATSQTLTWNAGAVLKFFTAETYRYWRFDIDDPTNVDGYIDIGRLWLGDYLQIDPSCLVNFKVVKKNSDRVVFGKDRQKFATPGVTWRRFEMNFPPTAHETIASIDDMYDVVGNHGAFIFCKFDTLRTYQIVEPCYCVIDGEIGFTHDNRMKFTYSLNLEEVK